MRQPEDQRGEYHERPVIGGPLLVAGGEAAELLKAVVAPLDDVAPPVDGRVERRLASGVVCAGMAVALIPQQPRGPPPGPPLPLRLRHVAGVQHGPQLGIITPLAPLSLAQTTT